MAYEDFAPNKKAATIRNLWWKRVAEPVLEADNVVAIIRAAILDNNLGSQFSEPERNAMEAVDTALGALSALAGIAAAEDKYNSGHLTEPITVGLEV